MDTPIASPPTPDSSSPADPSCQTLEPARTVEGAFDPTATIAKFQEAYKGLEPQAWEKMYDQAWSQKQEAKILAQQEAILGQVPVPGISVADWPYRSDGGHVLDEEEARRTRCQRIDLGTGHKPLVFSAGVIGALSDEQITAYCASGFDEQPTTPAQVERLTALSEASGSCSLHARIYRADDQLTQYYSCLGKELAKKGGAP